MSQVPSAFALDLCGFGVYPFPPGVAGAMSFHDPLEGTENRKESQMTDLVGGQVGQQLGNYQLTRLLCPQWVSAPAASERHAPGSSERCILYQAGCYSFTICP